MALESSRSHGDDDPDPGSSQEGGWRLQWSWQGDPFQHDGTSVFEKRGWTDWALRLNSEMRRVAAPHGEAVMKWLGRCEDRAISNEQLQQSGEFPRLDLMLAQELVRVADADCPELATQKSF